jgi:aerotolerance regulator-like protein
MTWLAPGAFAGLVLLAGPIVVHLLARRHARRMTFPATQFVRATQAAAVRLRRPSDIGLLLLRLAVVTATVLAAAQPVLITRWRVAQWNARVSRAVILDTSRSMPSPETASRLASQETAGAFRSRRIGTADLRDGLERAATWIRSTPPSRREVVVVSDFQRDAIDRDSLRRLPVDVGIRLVRAGTGPAERSASLTAVDFWRGGHWQPSAVVTGAGTRATWQREGTSEAPAWIDVFAAPADRDAAARAKRAAASFGIAAGDDSRQALVVFAGGEYAAAGAQDVHLRWMVEAADLLRRSDLLRDANVGVSVEDRSGRFVVRAPIAASALTAPAVVRTVMLALRPAAIASPELETTTIADSELAQWRRDPAPLAQRDPGHLDESDARWLWTMALVLLGVETWARRARVRTPAAEAEANAA